MVREHVALFGQRTRGTEQRNGTRKKGLGTHCDRIKKGEEEQNKEQRNGTREKESGNHCDKTTKGNRGTKQ